LSHPERWVIYLKLLGKYFQLALVSGHMPLEIHVASAETLSPNDSRVHYKSMNFALITYEIIDDKRLINLREIWFWSRGFIT